MNIRALRAEYAEIFERHAVIRSAFSSSIRERLAQRVEALVRDSERLADSGAGLSGVSTEEEDRAGVPKFGDGGSPDVESCSPQTSGDVAAAPEAPAFSFGAVGTGRAEAGAEDGGIRSPADSGAETIVAGAASMATVVCGAVAVVELVQEVREGKLTHGEAVAKILGELAASAAGAAIRASALSGEPGPLERHGSEERAVRMLAEQSLRNMLRTDVVTVGVVCIVDAVRDLVRFGTGDMSKEVFFERQGRGVLITSGGVVGGTLGMAGTMAFMGDRSEGSAILSAACLVGGLSGAMIGGLAMSLAAENGIAEPCCDLVQNAPRLHAATEELVRASEDLFRGQRDALQAGRALEKALNLGFYALMG